MSLWAVLTTGGTPVARNVDAPDEAAVRQQFDMRGKVVVALSRALGDFETVTLGGVIVDDAAPLRAFLLARVDDQREAARRGVMTQGTGQSYAYAEKAREVADYRSLAANVLAALTQPKRIARFPFAMAEVEASGDALAVVIARFESGIAASRARIAAIEAAATRAKRFIREGATAAAMRTAADVSWPAG